MPLETTTAARRSGYERVLAALNYDFSPGANRYVYWLKKPLGWLVIAAAASLLLGVYVAPQGFAMCAALTAVVALGICWPWVGLRGISCGLEFERTRAREGEAVQIRLSVVNRWPWPVWGLAIERGFFQESERDNQAPAAVALARVPGWSKSVFHWDFVPACRGRYPVEKPRLTTGFPFGLWQAQREVQTASQLLVWPRTFPLGEIPPIVGRERAIAGISGSHVGDEGDICGTRPYRNGDSLRHVHWPQTARYGRFIVCERQTTARRQVSVVIDVDPAAHAGCGSNGTLEWTVRVAASICQCFHAHGSSVTCQIGAQRIVAEPGGAGQRRLLDTIAGWNAASEGTLSPTPAALRQDREVLSLVVTTSAGLARWAADSRAEPRRFIVFESPELGVEPRAARPATEVLIRPWLTIRQASDLPIQFRKQWERACHDGWCANQ